MRFLIFCSCLFFSALSNALLPVGVSAGIAQFKMEAAQLPADYVTNLPNLIHNLLINAEREFNAKNKLNCHDVTNVLYVSEFQFNDQPAIKEFESSFVRIEVAKCLLNSTPEKVLAMITSMDFKKSAFTTLTSITSDGKNTVCETTAAPLLGKSHYCYKNLVDRTDSKYLKLFSINDWFEVTAQFDVPVYFRETILTTTQIGLDVQLHSVSYVRGPGLTALHRLFAKKFIISAQTEIFNKLAAAIQ